MDVEAFDKLWRQYTDGTFALPNEKEKQCIYAEHFASWADALYQDEVRAPSTIGLNQKMLLLTKKYFEWRAAVPKAHRDRFSERSHICIFHIFERTYHRLKVLELSLTPPMLFLPTAPAPVVQAIAGITLGEMTGQ